MARGLLVVLLVVPSLDAQRAIAEPSSTWLHRALLDRAPVIVRGRFVEDRLLPPFDVQVTTFEVVTSFKGDPPERVLVGAMGERGPAFPELDKILFLKPLSSGSLFEAVDVVDLTQAEEEVVPATLAAYLELAREKNPVAVQQRLRSLSLANLETGSTFAVRVALREIQDLLERAPFVFAASDLVRLQSARRAVPEGDRGLHAELCRRLARELADTFAGCEALFTDPAERQGFLEGVQRFRGTQDLDLKLRLLDGMARAYGRRLRLMLETLLRSRTPELRIRAAWLIGEIGDPKSLEAVMGGAEDLPLEDQRARIEALGKLGKEGAIPYLRDRLDDRDLVDEALLALARIGGAEADALLERIESRLAGIAGEEARGQRIRWLRSREFRDEEAARRRASREAYGG